MTKPFIMATLMCFLATWGANAETNRFVGGDISELPTMENAGAKYFDNSGKGISDIITYSYDQGMNSMRVRLFVDPDTFLKENSDGDPYACQSFEYILPICKRIKEAGLNLLLDFHYSDSWADPVKQWTPKLWETMTDEELYNQIYTYTKEVLENLKAENVVPDFIQTGNEISYGMCWGPYKTETPPSISYTDSRTNVDRFGKLLSNAIQACREVCPEAKIVIHSERTSKPALLTSLYEWANEIGLDYDIIGISYYPYYHGTVANLDNALKALENKKLGKDIWIVETGAAINWAIGDSDKQFYEPTDAGQNQFAKDLLAVLDKHSSVTGLFWWEMDYNAYWTSLQNWYNGSLFDNKTGKATSAFYTIAGWAAGESNGDDNNNDDEDVADYYLLYNNGGNWATPGTHFDNPEDGIYTLSNIEIFQTGQNYGWFAITSTNSTDWDVINAFRYGPENNNADPIGAESAVSLNNYSWQVNPGVYDLTFDAKNMTLKVVETAMIVEAADDIENQKGNVDGLAISLSAPQEATHACVYITAPEGVTNVYYLISNKAEVAKASIEGYTEAESKTDGRYSIALENGTQGTLNLYYATANTQSSPVAYTYSVVKDGSTGIGGIDTNNENAVYYNLNGMKVDNPRSGIFIKVTNGKSQKVLINK